MRSPTRHFCWPRSPHSWSGGGPVGAIVPVLALIVVLVRSGLGSFAFHTLATRGAVYLDVIPIAIFIYGYLPLGAAPFPGDSAGSRRSQYWSDIIALSRLLAHLMPPATLNGSIDYVPALAAMLIMLGFVPVTVRPHGRFGGGRVRDLARVSDGRPGGLRYFSAGHALHLAPAQRRGPVRAAAGSDPVRTESRMTYRH